MDNKSKSTVFQILFIVVTVLNLLISSLQNEKVAMVSGIPVEYVDKKISAIKDINQVAEDSNHIYILYDNSNDGIVQVYSQSGEYQKTIQCYSHMNGIFRIAVHDDIFYLCDKEGSLYCYYDGEFVEFIDSRKAASLRKSIVFETSSPNLDLRFGSVWKVGGQEDICIVEGPFSAMLYPSNLIPILGILVIFAVGILRMFRK